MIPPLLNHANGSIRSTAALSIGLFAPSVLAIRSRGLCEIHADRRTSAERARQEELIDSIAEQLAQLLGDPVPSVRAATAWALGKIPLAQAAHAAQLQRVSKHDPAREVRMNAVRALNEWKLRQQELQAACDLGRALGSPWGEERYREAVAAAQDDRVRSCWQRLTDNYAWTSFCRNRVEPNGIVSLASALLEGLTEDPQGARKNTLGRVVLQYDTPCSGAEHGLLFTHLLSSRLPTSL